MTNDEPIAQIKILYVEDDDVMSGVLTNFLKRRCNNVVIAKDGEEGLQLFLSENPDIVVTDICMPNMNGLDMAEKIREKSPTIPIIITTGYNEESFYQRAIDLDIDRYIKKPFSLKEFVKILSTIAKSIIQEKEIHDQSVLIKHILDLSQNFMIITDGVKISYANKAILKFAGVKNLAEFNKIHQQLSGLIQDDESAFYHGKTFLEAVAIAKIESRNIDSKLLVYIKKPDCKECKVFSYLLNVSQFPASNNLLLSFSDITIIEKETVYYKEIAQYDELTGIYNRKKFNEELIKAVNMVERYKAELSIVFFDIDHFKKINDKHGHLMGDYVLKEIVTVVESSIRKTDILSRYGGEEFTLIMPHTEVSDAIDTAERIRNSIEQHKFQSIKKVTCSFGVTDYKVNEQVNEFVDRADKALYIAKNNGRNKVERL